VQARSATAALVATLTGACTVGARVAVEHYDRAAVQAPWWAVGAAAAVVSVAYYAATSRRFGAWSVLVAIGATIALSLFDLAAVAGLALVAAGLAIGRKARDQTGQ
jgi:hypothetical protein